MGCTMRHFNNECGMPDWGCMATPRAGGREAGLTGTSDFGTNADAGSQSAILSFRDNLGSWVVLLQYNELWDKGSSVIHSFTHLSMQWGSNDSHMLQQAGVVDVSDHILYVSLSLKCNACSGWNAWYHILLHQLLSPQSPNIRLVPRPHPNPGECWLACRRACSHRYNSSTTVPTLTAHIFAVSVLPVLETGLSGTKSSPDLGEHFGIVWMAVNRSTRVLKQYLF